MAVGVEYIRDVLAASPTGPRTATAFLEGQTEATNIAANQLRQQQAEQAMRYAEMQQPYVMAGLERGRQAGDIQLQEERAAIERANKARELPIDLRGGAVAPITGQGLRPGLNVPAAPTGGVAPELLAPTPMGGQAGGFDYATYASRMLPAEGTGRNVRSTAQGPGQFLNSTFIDTFKKTFPESARAMSDAQILAQRGTGVETAMLKKFTEDNIAAFEKAGIQPTMANVYLAHFLGIGGAQNVLTKPADTPITQVVDQAAIAANPSVFNKVRTVGDLEAWAAGKMGELSTAGVQERKAAAFREQYPIAGAVRSFFTPSAALPVTPAPTAGLATTTSSPGMVQPGNINLNTRPIVRNADGSISTVRSMSFNEDGVEVLIPTVAADGSRILSNEEAVAQYRKTGQHLGKFTTPQAADAYAEQLHNDQAAQYLPRAAGIQEPGKSIVGEIVRQPVGAEPITVNTKELLEPLRLQQETSQLNATLRFYETEYKRAALLSDFSTMRALGEKMVQMQPVANMLSGMQALTEFNAGRPEAIANIMYQRTGGRMQLQPRSDGKFNVYDGNKMTREGISKETLTAHFRMLFDQDYKTQVSEAITRERSREDELFKSTLKQGEKAFELRGQLTKDMLVKQVEEAARARYGRNARVEKMGDDKQVIYDGTTLKGVATVEQELDPATGQPVFYDPLTKMQPKLTTRFTPATQ